MNQSGDPVSRIVIIGGGLSGLAAADAIAAQRPPGDQTEIRVLEAKRVTGGRAGSFETGQGECVDYCQHVAMGCCTELLDWMRRTGLLEHWVAYDELTYLKRGVRSSRFRPLGFLPPPLHLAPTIPAMRYFSPRQKVQLVSTLWRLLRTPTDSLRQQTAGDWLAGQAVDPEIVARFWEIILVSALGDTLDRVSMAAARKGIVDGFCLSRDSSVVWVPSRPLSELFGTMLTSKVADQRVHVECGVRVREVSRIGEASAEHDVANRFRVSVSVGDDLEADEVIVAAPWHRWSAIIDHSLKQRLGPVDQWSSVDGSPITGLHLWTQRPLTDLPHAVLLDSRSQWFFRDPHVGGEGRYSQVVISGSRSIRKSSAREPDAASWGGEVIDELSAYFDVDAAGLIERSRAVTDPNSVYSLTPETDRMRPSARSPVPGFYWASDFAQTDWPSTMEGAVRAGRQAAREVARRRGWKPIPAAAEPRRGFLGRLLIRR